MTLKLRAIKNISICIIVLVAGLLGLRFFHFSIQSDTTKVAKAYLEQEGFIVLHYAGENGPYRVTKRSAMEFPHSKLLAVQEQPVDFYRGRDLHDKSFYVANHPLQTGYTSVVLMMDGEEVVGAVSVRNGQVHSLHGKTAEEMSTEK